MRWGVQLVKIGVNTASISTVTNRLVNGIIFGARNTSLTLKIGGRNIVGTASSTTTSSKVAYNFNSVTLNEAKAIFSDLTAGRGLKVTDLGNGRLIETAVWESNGVKSSISYRNFSKTGQLGDPVIDINVLLLGIKKLNLNSFYNGIRAYQERESHNF